MSRLSSTTLVGLTVAYITILGLVAVAIPVTAKPGHPHKTPKPTATPASTSVSTPRPTPTALPTATPTPPSGTTPSAPITVTADNVTIDGKAFTGGSNGFGIQAIGTASQHIRNLVIRHCTFTGFFGAIWVDFVDNVTIEDNTVDGAKYSGIMVLSSVGGTVQRNTVRNIGLGGQIGVTNAYGIAISQQQDADPQSTDTVVQDNTVDNVPTWHGLDTHAGIRVRFLRNTVTRARHGIFVTAGGPRSNGVIVDSNRVTTPPGADQYAYVAVYSDNPVITNNVASGWPSGHELLLTDGGRVVTTNPTVTNNSWQQP